MTYYIGPEVNHTPAFSKKTLFVEGFQNTEAIESVARENKTPHISLSCDHEDDAARSWNNQLTELLDKGFMVTLNYPAALHNQLMFSLSKGVLQSRNFVPLPCVLLYNMSILNPNLTVKIDDGSGEGTWTMHYHELMDSNRFTAVQDIQKEPIRTSYAYIEKPPLPDLKVFTEILTPKAPKEEDKLPDLGFELGLAPDEKSALKDDPEETKTVINVKTPDDAAAVYADGATKDPLSAEASKKPIKKK